MSKSSNNDTLDRDANRFGQWSEEIQAKVKTLGQEDQKAISTFCTGPGTADSDAKHVAHALQRADVDEETARDEMQALYGRFYPKDTRAIPRVIQKAYHPGNTNFKSKGKRRVAKFTNEQIALNLKAIKSEGIEPLEIQPELEDMPMGKILPALYGEDPKVLVCLARSKNSPVIKPLGDWLKLPEEKLKRYQLRCANPMRKLSGINQEGKPSIRCEDTSATELDLLTYETDKGFTEADQLKVINYLAQGLPLVSVCWSANDSRHATYSVKGLTNALKQKLKDRFASLGGDPMVMETYHLMRTPNAIRNDHKAKGVKQTLLWINGANREKKVDCENLPLIGIVPTDIVTTEVAESQQFREFVGDDYLFNDNLGWLRWSGNHWEKIGNSVLLNEAMAFQNHAIKRGEKKRAKMLGKKNTLQNIVDLSRVGISPELKVEHFDSDPMLLGVANGTIDLTVGSFRPAERDDMISRVLSVTYDPDADCPKWEAFLERIFRTHPELIGYIQRLMGYILTGDVSEQQFSFFFGGGSNGKSTLITVIQELMGPYATKLPRAAYVTVRNGKTDTALSHLENARVAIGDELNEHEHLADGIVKTLTGGDRLQARRLHQMEFEFNPMHKLIMFGNHKPRIVGSDEGIWRRVHLVPFVEEINKAEKDPKLGDKLKTELPGILNWAIKGCTEWQCIGLDEPQVMIDAKDEYRGEEDIIQQFIDDKLDFADPKARTTRNDLYSTYERWAKADGAPAKTKRNFLSAIRAKGIKDNAKRMFSVGLKDDDNF